MKTSNKLLCVVLFAFLIASCSYDQDNATESLHIEINNSEEYHLDLGFQQMIDRPNGIVDANITEQAEHFKKSELEFVVTGLGLNDTVIYTYLALENFVGTDYVEIMVCKAANCESPDSKLETVKIYFTVTE